MESSRKHCTLEVSISASSLLSATHTAVQRAELRHVHMRSAALQLANENAYTRMRNAKLMKMFRRLDHTTHVAFNL